MVPGEDLTLPLSYFSYCPPPSARKGRGWVRGPSPRPFLALAGREKKEAREGARTHPRPLPEEGGEEKVLSTRLSLSKLGAK